MPIRFFQRFKIAPGLTLNLSKWGGSLSVGPPGAKFTFGTAGTRGTVGIPGSGLYYTEHNPLDRRRGKRGSPAPEGESAADRLDLGFFRRLITPPGEEAFVDGLRQIHEGDEAGAWKTLSQATVQADAAFMAGILALKRQQPEAAIDCLSSALDRGATLGELFKKYEIRPTVSLSITDHIDARIEPAARGIALALAEAYQMTAQWSEALDVLESIHAAQPEDPVVTLSMVEILAAEIATPDAYQRVVSLTRDADNTDEIRAAICYWKGRALHELGLHTAARDALTLAFRRKKDRSDAFLLAVQYERACVYDALGKKTRAREEFERIYAADPGYEDVGSRLGLVA